MNTGSKGYTITPIEITVSCNNLKNMDRTSRSDPFVIICENQNGKWDEIGRTEVIRDNLNPEFATKFKLDYSFEKHQKYRFSVFDQDEGQKCDFLGFGFSTVPK